MWGNLQLQQLLCPLKIISKHNKKGLPDFDRANKCLRHSIRTIHLRNYMMTHLVGFVSPLVAAAGRGSLDIFVRVSCRTEEDALNIGKAIINYVLALDADLCLLLNCLYCALTLGFFFNRNLFIVLSIKYAVVWWR